MTTHALDFARDLDLPPAAEVQIEDLQFMAAYKYDRYEMYTPPIRFLEQLRLWLGQFETEDRPIALRFLRERLIFISQREMQDLARFLYYNRIVPALLSLINREQGLKPFEYAVAFREHLRHYLRRSLFIALSDGAKIDYFRRHHIELSQEQIIPYYRSSHDDYVATLRRETGDPTASFSSIFLIDDFTGSGYTMIHQGVRGFEGSLLRVYEHHRDIIDAAAAVYVCHYIATEAAHEHTTSLAMRTAAYGGKHFECLSALPLSPHVTVDPDVSGNQRDADYVTLINKYFRDEFDDANSKKGGTARSGFGGVALPLVLYSNTPNNSVFLIWYQPPSNGTFVPLFPRIPRHRPQA
jgi:hypothetical protein